MLQCQLALDPGLQKQDRIKTLRAKRDTNWDPAQRWKVMQEFLTWAEQQATVRRNTPEACLREQRRKLKERGELPDDE